MGKNMGKDVVGSAELAVCGRIVQMATLETPEEYCEEEVVPPGNLCAKHQAADREYEAGEYELDRQKWFHRQMLARRDREVERMLSILTKEEKEALHVAQARHDPAHDAMAAAEHFLLQHRDEYPVKMLRAGFAAAVRMFETHKEKDEKANRARLRLAIEGAWDLGAKWGNSPGGRFLRGGFKPRILGPEK